MEQPQEQTKEQTTNSRPWLYKKGQSGNPGGRPVGRKSLKMWVKERLESMTDEEREEFIVGMPKENIWKMGEGNPKQDTDMNASIKIINVTVPDPVAKAFNINATNTETNGGNPEQG